MNLCDVVVVVVAGKRRKAVASMYGNNYTDAVTDRCENTIIASARHDNSEGGTTIFRCILLTHKCNVFISFETALLVQGWLLRVFIRSLTEKKLVVAHHRSHQIELMNVLFTISSAMATAQKLVSRFDYSVQNLLSKEVVKLSTLRWCLHCVTQIRSSARATCCCKCLINIDRTIPLREPIDCACRRCCYWPILTLEEWSSKERCSLIAPFAPRSPIII